MCSAGHIGELWASRLANGEVDYIETANFFRMTPQTVMEHVNTHAVYRDPTTGDYDSPDFYLKELLDVLKVLKSWLEYCVNQQTISPREIDIGIRLSKELRETLKAVGEFQGRLNRERESGISLTEIEQNYNRLTNIILTEVCGECQEKILRLMEEKQKTLPRISRQ